MLPVYDKPTIQHVIEEAIASGIEDILIITGRNKRSIENHFDKLRPAKGRKRQSFKASQKNHRPCRYMLCSAKRLMGGG